MKTILWFFLGVGLILTVQAQLSTNSPTSGGTSVSSGKLGSNVPPGTVITLPLATPVFESKSEQMAAEDIPQTNNAAIAGKDFWAVEQKIEPMAGGAKADFGLLKANFAANANSERVLVVTTPDGRKLSAKACYLAWYDTATGNSLLLGEIQDRIGIIRLPNEVIFTNAFDGISADLRYRYTGFSLEQDIVLHANAELPKGWNEETTRLEVWTEWFDTEEPVKETQIINLRANLFDAPPADVNDDTLTFGSAKIILGKAFASDNEQDTALSSKAWTEIEKRTFLIETLDYRAIKTMLETLPKAEAAAGPFNLKRADLRKELPERRAAREENRSMEVAVTDLSGEPAVVLDFVIVSSVPVPANIISWWPAGGNATDAIIANGNNGTWLGTAAYGAGKVGQGFSLGGVSNAVTVPNTASLNFGVAQDFSMETWIKPLTNTNPYGIMSIIGKRYYAGIGYELFLIDGQLGFQIGDPVNGYLNVGVTGDLRADGQYHHIAVTVDRDDPDGGKLYVDGVANFFDPTAISDDLSNAEPFRIGVHPDSYFGYFKGNIDEPAVYARALGESEIQGIYNAGAAGKINPNCVVAPTNIVAWWPGDGNTNDFAGTNNATLSGATYESAVASQGFSFDGINDGVTAANDNALNLATTNEHVTIEAWVKPLANTNTYGVMSVVGKRHSPNSSTAYGYELFLVNGVPGFQIANGTSYANFIATGDLRDGGFHHLVVTMNRSATNGGHIYVDGVSKLTFNPTVLTASLSNSAPVRIGVHPQSGFNGWYKGVIDEVTLYRRALTNTEVTALYSAGCAGKCKHDLDYDGLPDWWEIKYFGNLDQTAEGDYDQDGDSNLAEYQNATDPNTINFTTTFYPGDHVNANSATGRIEVLRGVASQIAVLVNSTNYASATWTNFSNTNVIAGLGTTDGQQDIWIGLRGRSEDSEQTWEWNPIIRDTTAPTIVITNPIASTTSRPMIQLQGYSPEALSAIYFDVTNSAGLITNQQGFVSAQYFNTNTLTFTTNWFECLDIGLTNGTNKVTLRVTDLAGNSSTNVYNYALDFSGDTNAPAIQLYWPQNGAQISGTSFTLRSFIDDPTAQVSAQIVDTNGVTNVVSALVERNGLLWVEGLPLSSGTNMLTLVATDAAGNVATTNINIVKSTVDLTINTLDESQLNNANISVSGTISTTGFKVWVNGVEAAISGSSWSADNVPLSEGGTALVQARAIPTSDNGGNGTGGSGGTSSSYTNPGNPSSASAITAELQTDKPAVVQIISQTITYNFEWDYGDGQTGHSEEEIPWVRGKEVRGFLHTVVHTPTTDSDSMSWHVWPPCSPGPGVICGESTCTSISTVTQNGQTTTTTNECQPAQPQGYWMEHGKIGGILRNLPNPQGWLKVKHTGDTQVQLFTGGKAGSNRKNLFVITASATEYTDVFDSVGRAIPYTDLDIPDLGRLGNDGRLYKVLEDNRTVDVTVKAPQKFYTFTVTPQKCKLTIKANTAYLEPDTVVSNAAFCVGQKVTFEPVWNGEPPGIQGSNTTFQWTFDGTYMNYATQSCTTCSIDYSNLSDLLKKEITANWWVTGKFSPPADYSAEVEEKLTFTNGQKAKIVANGRFGMHRPRLTNYRLPVDPLSASVRHGHIYGETNALNDILVADRPAEYLVDVDSLFDGSAGITQLWNGYATNASSGINTFGTIQLDNQEFYMNTLISVQAQFIANEIYFQDGPGLDCIGNTFLQVDFTDYGRFRPDAGTPDENIYVTLGIVNWDVHASTALTQVSGQAFSDYTPPRPVGTNIPHKVTTPSAHIDGSVTPSEAFPHWSQVATNIPPP